MKHVKIFILITVLVMAVFLTACSSKQDPEALKSFASCLTDKGAKMYGAYWCSHCQDQKKIFGAAFAKIDYVECTQETQKCDDEQITGYPTWIFSDNSRLNGVQTLASLGQKTGCVLSSNQ